MTTQTRTDVTETTKYRRPTPSLLVAAVALVGAGMAPASWAAEEVPFSISKMIIEFNATADDVGVQVLLDGEPWKKLAIFSPTGRRILDVAPRRSLQLQGLTELFFESSEPSLDDLPLADFLARFPAGIYEFEGETVDGVKMEGEATFTHVIPAGPEIVSPVSFTQDPPVVDPDSLVIEWEPVTTTIASGALTIAGYQVIVEQVTPLRVLSLALPAAVTSVVIPPEFFVQLGTLHKFEVLAIEAGGNQTITEGEFVTFP